MGEAGRSGGTVSVDALLVKLDRVRETGQGRWVARCPAHEDKRPSLSIRELPDGRILLNDFGGCGIEEVLAALSLEFSDLYPERAIEHAPRECRPFNAHDVLACIASEALLVVVAAGNIAQGVMLTDADRQRLVKAAGRIEAARGLANGER